MAQTPNSQEIYGKHRTTEYTHAYYKTTHTIILLYESGHAKCAYLADVAGRGLRYSWRTAGPATLGSSTLAVATSSVYLL